MAISKFINNQLRQTIIDKLREGHSDMAVAEYVGLNRATLYEWWKRGDDEAGDETSLYAEFRRQCKKAKSEAEFEAVGVIRQAAKDGVWQSACWWLERTRSDVYGKAEWRAQKLNPKEQDDYVIDLSEEPDENNQTIEGD